MYKKVDVQTEDTSRVHGLSQAGYPRLWSSRSASCWFPTLYEILTAAVTNSHNCTGLKQYYSHTSGGQKSELGLSELKSEVSKKGCLPLELLGKNHFLSCSSSCRNPAFLGSQPHHLQSQQSNHADLRILHHISSDSNSPASLFRLQGPL